MEENPLIILAFEGSEDRMRKLWSRALGVSGDSLQVKTVTPGDNLKTILEFLLFDDGIPERFTVIPANTFSAKPVQFQELQIPYVYVSIKGERSFASCLPMQFRKGDLVDLLAADGTDGESLCAAYCSSTGTVPFEASFHFGNVVTPVRRGNPCISKVLEGFVQRKFVSAVTPQAWEAIVPLVDKLLADE